MPDPVKLWGPEAESGAVLNLEELMVQFGTQTVKRELPCRSG